MGVRLAIDEVMAIYELELMANFIMLRTLLAYG